MDKVTDEISEVTRAAKHLFVNSAITNDLAFIEANFSFIRSSITKLKTRGLPLDESIPIMELVYTTLKNLMNSA